MYYRFTAANAKVKPSFRLWNYTTAPRHIKLVYIAFRFYNLNVCSLQAHLRIFRGSYLHTPSTAITKTTTLTTTTMMATTVGQLRKETNTQELCRVSVSVDCVWGMSPVVICSMSSDSTVSRTRESTSASQHIGSYWSLKPISHHRLRPDKTVLSSSSAIMAPK